MSFIFFWLMRVAVTTAQGSRSSALGSEILIWVFAIALQWAIFTFSEMNCRHDIPVCI